MKTIIPILFCPSMGIRTEFNGGKLDKADLIAGAKERYKLLAGMPGFPSNPARQWSIIARVGGKTRVVVAFIEKALMPSVKRKKAKPAPALPTMPTFQAMVKQAAPMIEKAVKRVKKELKSATKNVEKMAGSESKPARKRCKGKCAKSPKT